MVFWSISLVAEEISVIKKNKVKTGMSQSKLKKVIYWDGRFAIGGTSSKDDPFLKGCSREYYSDSKQEILIPKSKKIYFVFENVTSPGSVSKKKCSVGSGTLQGYSYSYTGALALIRSRKEVTQTPQIAEIETGVIYNEPPRIEIAEKITVYSQAYIIKGRIRGKGKQFYLDVNGQPVPTKTNGEFEFERFNVDPDIVEVLRLVVRDQWNNRSEKNVQVTVNLDQQEFAKRYEKLKPLKINGYKDDNKIAIIIGIEKYVNLTNLDAPFANRDASAFREYTNRALGVKSSNIKLLVDHKASRSKILETFKLWLPRIAGEGGKDIYIFFAGHGLSSDDGKDLYILPQDGNSKLLEDTAITRVELIKLIQKVNPKSVTMFFDTCYSGQTRDERMLVASKRSIIIVPNEQETPNNFTIFSASNFDQTSTSIEEVKHGIFSYFLMKGLEGNADDNRDKEITNGELIAYLKTNVSREAFSQAREQDPTLVGNHNQVLMRYR